MTRSTGLAESFDRRRHNGGNCIAESPSVQREVGTWLASWLEACAELDRLQAGNPMLDAVIDEVDGRRIRIGDRWLHDFASCNYLGLDLDREVIEGIPAYLDRWGTHPGWSRMLGSPVLYEQIEAELRELLEVEDVLLLPTLTHIHAAVIPVLADGGTVLLDARAHKTVYDGAVIARARGAALQRFATTTLRRWRSCCAGDLRRPG